MVIKQSSAMVCVRLGCEVIWEGPSNICPKCKHEGVSYREVEALATGIPAYTPEPKMVTTMIQ
jgi:hypothetical protein